MFGQFEKSVYLCTRKSDNEELNGSVAQLNRASDYGSEGCGFESRRNHKGEEIERFSLFLFCISLELHYLCSKDYNYGRFGIQQIS